MQQIQQFRQRGPDKIRTRVEDFSPVDEFVPGSGLCEIADDLQLVPHRPRPVDAQHHQIPGVGALDSCCGSCDLVEDDLDVLDSAAARLRAANSVDDQTRGLAGCASAQPLVLSDDDVIEVEAGLIAEIDHVLIATITGGRDDPDALWSFECRHIIEEPVDEIPERDHGRGIVAVIDDHFHAAYFGQVHPTRSLVERRRERAQPGADVVQVSARAVGGAGCCHRILDIEHRLTTEGRGQQMRIGQRHPASPVHQHDLIPQFTLFQNDGLPTAAAVIGDHSIVLPRREPDDLP